MPALRYQAVLFDLDGTLVDSYAALAQALNYARAEYGLDALDEAHIRGFVGEGVEKLLQRTFEIETIPDRARQAFERRYDQVCCGESRILEDVESTLAELQNIGVKMAVCTNKPTGFSIKILEFLNLSSRFCSIVGPDVAGARKPAAQHVLVTQQSTGCSLRDTLFVGDMPIDIEAARNSGIDVAVVATGSATAEQLNSARPDHFLNRFSDVILLVRNGDSH